MLLFMTELSRKDHEKRFNEAICEVIESIGDYQEINIISSKVDVDNIITVMFKSKGEEFSEFFDLSYVEYVLKKNTKKLEKQLKAK